MRLVILNGPGALNVDEELSSRGIKYVGWTAAPLEERQGAVGIHVPNAIKLEHARLFAATDT
jgi:hypothetical protein